MNRIKKELKFLYNLYYKDNPQLLNIVLVHSGLVAKKALEISEKKNLPINKNDIIMAAMLHDIGVVKCNAPDIFANGTFPYICHGIEGKKILEKHGYHTFANVCIHHTGSGITKENIIENKLPLPPIDMLPQTLLEKLICYADKFFSKSKDLQREKSIEEVIRQMKKFSTDSYERFMDLYHLFSFEKKI